MTTSRARTILPTIAIATLTVLLTGCSGSGAGPSATATSTGTSTSAASTGLPSDSPTSAATTASPSGAGATAEAVPGAAGTAPAAAPPGTTTSRNTAAGNRCATSQLTGSVADGGSSAPGTQRVAIILRNTGSGPCTLQGWPGVSFVGGGNGSQIGNPAVLDRATPHPTLTLRPHGEVQAVVTVKQAGDWDSATCEPRVTDGFRVIPPGSSQALFVGASGPLFESCASTDIHQLTTSALASF
jgi:hypothetical protein